MRSKYHASKFTNASGAWDSHLEYYRYCFLRKAEAEGTITDLRRQVEYVLIPKQVGERQCTYKADFVYKLKGSSEDVVEDTKGVRTPDYVIKRKLMLFRHGIRIKEVERPAEKI